MGLNEQKYVAKPPMIFKAYSFEKFCLLRIGAKFVKMGSKLVILSSPKKLQFQSNYVNVEDRVSSKAVYLFSVENFCLSKIGTKESKYEPLYSHFVLFFCKIGQFGFLDFLHGCIKWALKSTNYMNVFVKKFLLAKFLQKGPIYGPEDGHHTFFHRFFLFLSYWYVEKSILTKIEAM